MRGELDFFGSLKSRVALLKGEDFDVFPSWRMGSWDLSVYPIGFPWEWYGLATFGSKCMVNRGTYTSPMDPMG